MSLPSSFIFSSDRTKPARISTALVLAAWVMIGLAAIDTLINVVFFYPSDPKITNPSILQSYFDYGRSQEGKLRRITRSDKTQTAPITLAGWYDPLVVEEPAANSSAEIVIGALGATANWAYGAYLRDRGGGVSRVVVLAFMSGNLAMTNTMSPMTWNTDFAMPYTADQFFLEDGILKAAHPPYSSFDDYVQALFDKNNWLDALRAFAKSDSMYNSFIIRASVFDHSTFFRLFRHAYAHRMIREHRHAVLDHGGFNPNSNEVKVAQKIVLEFAMRARSDGMIPIIFVVNLLGDSDYMFQALKAALDHDKILYLNSAKLASPNDPRKYLRDSHFTPEVDNEMARALVKIIDKASHN